MPKETDTNANNTKRHSISLEMKQKICRYFVEHPGIQHKELAGIFNLENSRSTISKILLNKNKWLSEDVSGNLGKLTRKREDRYPKTNEALSLWVTGALANGLTLSGAIIRTKALFFAASFPLESDFKGVRPFSLCLPRASLTFFL